MSTPHALLILWRMRPSLVACYGNVKVSVPTSTTAYCALIGAICLVDVADRLTGLWRVPGLATWKVYVCQCSVNLII